jgi:hypothetical protein
MKAMLSVAASQEMEIIQFDIAIAFLNSELKEEIHTDQPKSRFSSVSVQGTCKDQSKNLEHGMRHLGRNSY